MSQKFNFRNRLKGRKFLVFVLIPLRLSYLTLHLALHNAARPARRIAHDIHVHRVRDSDAWEAMESMIDSLPVPTNSTIDPPHPQFSECHNAAIC